MNNIEQLDKQALIYKIDVDWYGYHFHCVGFV